MMIRLFYSVLFLFVLLSGCKKNDPVSPPPPTMTGRWDVTWTGPGGSITGLMDLTENNGALSGTITIANLPVAFSGTVSLSYQVVLGGSDSGGRYLITGTTTAQKNTFTGKMDLWNTRTIPETYTGSLNMSATKR
ncbi:MAG TPA: hypothetical protein VNI77_05960 [Nitrososphaera sp.]|nr:hypothetical protein [Nitrososphaera sp.]